jgi:hypothetical protein
MAIKVIYSFVEYAEKGLYKVPWQRGAVDIASASGTEDPGSNHARVYVF